MSSAPTVDDRKLRRRSKSGQAGGRTAKPFRGIPKHLRVRRAPMSSHLGFRVPLGVFRPRVRRTVRLTSNATCRTLQAWTAEGLESPWTGLTSEP